MDSRRERCGSRVRPRFDIGVRVADHPAGSELQPDFRRGIEKHPRLRLATVAGLREGRVDTLRMVHAVAVVVDRGAGVGEKPNDPFMNLTQIGKPGFSLRGGGLVGDDDGAVPERPKRRIASADPGTRATLSRTFGASKAPSASSQTSSTITPSRSRKTPGRLTARGSRIVDRLPLARRGGKLRVRDEKMPDDRLELLDVRSSSLRWRLDDDAEVGLLRGCSVGSTDDAEDACADGSGEPDRTNEIRRHVVVAATAAHGENEQGIARREARGSEPGLEARVPALVVRASRELGDVVGRSVGLEVAQLPKVVDCMRRVGCAASNPENEEAALPASHRGERARELIHGGRVD